MATIIIAAIIIAVFVFALIGLYFCCMSDIPGCLTDQEIASFYKDYKKSAGSNRRGGGEH